MASKKFDFKKIGMKAAGLAVGAVAANVASAKIPFVANLNPKIQGVGKIVLGALLPTFVKNDFVEHVGDGMIAAGAGQLVGNMLGIAGVGAFDDSVGEAGYVEDYEYPMNGITDDSAVSEIQDDNAMSGDDDDQDSM